MGGSTFGLSGRVSRARTAIMVPVTASRSSTVDTPGGAVRAVPVDVRVAGRELVLKPCPQLVDPLIDFDTPQQMNGYTYGNANPTTTSDPDGLMPCPPDLPKDECAIAQHKVTVAPASAGPDSYDQARAKFFGTNVPPGHKRKIIKTNAKAPGNGIIVMRFFISDGKFYVVGQGDGRGFSTDVAA